MSQKPKGLQHTLQVRLYQTPEQGRLLMEQVLEYRDALDIWIALRSRKKDFTEENVTPPFSSQLGHSQCEHYAPRIRPGRFFRVGTV